MTGEQARGEVAYDKPRGANQIRQKTVAPYAPPRFPENLPTRRQFHCPHRNQKDKAVYQKVTQKREQDERRNREEHQHPKKERSDYKAEHHYFAVSWLARFLSEIQTCRPLSETITKNLMHITY